LFLFGWEGGREGGREGGDAPFRNLRFLGQVVDKTEPIVHGWTDVESPHDGEDGESLHVEGESKASLANWRKGEKRGGGKEGGRWKEI